MSDIQYYDTVEDFKKANNPGQMVCAKITETYTVYIQRREFIFQKDEVYVLSPHMRNQIECGKCVDTEMDPSIHDKMYNGENLEGKSILVSRMGGIGDLLFIQPSLRYLKSKYPTCKISIATSSSYMSLVNRWECVDKRIAMPLSVSQINSHDFYVSFHGLIELCKQAEVMNAYDLFSTYMGLGVLPDEYRKPCLTPDKQRKKKWRTVLNKYGISGNNDFIYVQIKASCINRTPPIAFWYALFDELLNRKMKVVVCDSPSENETLNKIINQYILTSRRPAQCVINVSKYSEDLQDMIALISMSKFVVAPDSSSVHIAGGLDVPCYGLYTAFPASIRVATYKYAYYNDTIHNENICEYGGRNCFLHSTQKCKRLYDGYPNCMYNQLKPKSIANTISTGNKR